MVSTARQALLAAGSSFTAIVLFHFLSYTTAQGIDLTAGTWHVTGVDDWGNTWDDTSLWFTSQDPARSGFNVRGYFDWIGYDRFQQLIGFGREIFTGTFSDDRSLHLTGESLEPIPGMGGPYRIINGIYDADVTVDGTRIVDGTWSGSGGVPGIWEAVLERVPETFHAPFYAQHPHQVTQGPFGAGQPEAAKTHKEEFDHTQYDIDFAPRTGVDGTNKFGDEVVVPTLAAADGRAYFWENRGCWGNVAVVDHSPNQADPGQKVFTLYAHLQDIRLVNGQLLKAGDPIGIEGSTGTNPVTGKACSTGRHLHFGLYRGAAERFERTALGLDPSFGGMELLNKDGEAVVLHTADFMAMAGQTFASPIERPRELDRTGQMDDFGQQNGSRAVTYSFLTDATTPSLDVVLNGPPGTWTLRIVDPEGSEDRVVNTANGRILTFFDNPSPGRLWSFVIEAGDDVPTSGQFTFRLKPAPVLKPGDLSANDAIDVRDIDILTHVLLASDQFLDQLTAFDLNRDGRLSGADRLAWIQDMAWTYVGDSNLDGQFSSGDLVHVFQTGQYEDGVVRNSTWATGDWNGDGEFASDDFIFAFLHGGYEWPPRAAAAVPEPSGVLLLVALGLGSWTARRRTSFLHRWAMLP